MWYRANRRASLADPLVAVPLILERQVSPGRAGRKGLLILSAGNWSTSSSGPREGRADFRGLFARSGKRYSGQLSAPADAGGFAAEMSSARAASR